MPMENDTPLVSIIIPTHNRPDLLLEALESVRKQSYPHWEAIIVDNGAVNKVDRLVESLNEPRFNYHYREEGNRSKARNFGVSVAKGDYIAFLDDDDHFLPDKLLEQVSYLNSHPDVGLVGCGAILIDEKGEKIYKWTLWDDSPELVLRQGVKGLGLMPTAIMMRKLWFEEQNGFDTTLHLAEDLDFFLNLMYRGCKMEWVRFYLVEYRMHSGNSRSDPIQYGENYDFIINRIYSKPNLPADVLEIEQYAKSRFMLLAFANTYLEAKSNPALYQQGLRFYQKACEYDPDLKRNKTGVMEALIAAARRDEVEEPYAYGVEALEMAGKLVPIPHKYIQICKARLAQHTFARLHDRKKYQRALYYFRKAASLRLSWLRHRAVWGMLKNIYFHKWGLRA